MAENFIAEAEMNEKCSPNAKQSSESHLIYGMLSKKKSIVDNKRLAENHQNTGSKELNCVVFKTSLVKFWVLLS